MGKKSRSKGQASEDQTQTEGNKMDEQQEQGEPQFDDNQDPDTNFHEAYSGVNLDDSGNGQTLAEIAAELTGFAPQGDPDGDPDEDAEDAEEAGGEGDGEQLAKVATNGTGPARGMDRILTQGVVTGDGSDARTGFVGEISSTTATGRYKKVGIDGRVMTFAQLEAIVALSSQNTEDSRPLVGTIAMENRDGRLTLSTGHGFSTNGLKSAWEWAGLKKPVLDFLQGKAYLDDIARYFNDAIAEKNPQEPCLVRLRKRVKQDGTPSLDENGVQLLTVRAIRNSNFYPLDNAATLVATREALKVSGGMTDDQISEAACHQFFYDGDMLSVAVCPGAENYQTVRPDGQWFIGVHHRNSETGDGSACWEAFVRQGRCDNGSIFGKKSITDANSIFAQRHTGKQPTWEELQKNVNNVVTAAAKEAGLVIGQYDIARTVEVTNLDAMVVGMSRRLGLPTTLGRQWYEGVKRSLALDGIAEDANTGTYFHLINGLTDAAKNYKGDAQRDVQARAIELLSEDPATDKVKDMQRRVKRFHTAAMAGLDKTEITTYLTGKLDQTAALAPPVQQQRVLLAA